MSPVDVLTASDAAPGKGVAAPTLPTQSDLARRARERDPARPRGHRRPRVGR